MNCRKQQGKSAGRNVKPMTQPSQKPAGGVTRTSGAEPKDYKMVPDKPVETQARILKYSV